MVIICERVKAVSPLNASFRHEADPTLSKNPELLPIFLRERGSRQSAPIDFPSPIKTVSAPDFSPRPDSPTPSATSSSYRSSVASPSIGSLTGHRHKREHDFLLFSYLLRFVHREGKVGDDARAGLLSLVDVAMGSASPFSSSSSGMHRSATSSTITSAAYAASPAREAALAFAEYLLDSDFADVLGAGVGALYGLLPGKLVVRTTETRATPDKAKSWDDPVVTENAGAMVLGGLGALGDDEDGEEAERKMEEEDARLQSLGVGISTSLEFKEALESWLKLVEFVQEVLKRMHSMHADGISAFDADDVDDDIRQQQLITSGLSTAILSSIRSLFLQSVLYPSILECSDQDGSAVAVMSFLQAMLDVVPEGSSLEQEVLGFLMGEEETRSNTKTRRPMLGSPVGSTTGHILDSPRLAHSAPNGVKKRKSSALLIVEGAAPIRSPSYYAALGRFSLKDLLASHLDSESQPTATAAFKLLHTLVARHDRWSVGLLDVVPDDAATSFPIALRHKLHCNDAHADDDLDSDSDVFVYPSPQVSPLLKAPAETLQPTATPARARAILGAPLSSTPSIRIHLDHLDTLLSLVASIDPSYRNARAAGDGSELMSSGLVNYIRDAEVALASNPGFTRGLRSSSRASGHVEEPITSRRRSTLFGATPALSPKTLASVESGIRHRLKPNSKLVALTLTSMSQFFSHSPDLNLALTAVLAAMAIYPYRSLEGWLLPPVREDEASDLQDLIDRDLKREAASDDGDDRSIDCAVHELGRQDSLFSPAVATPARPSPTRAALAKSDSLLSILAALADSVAQYRLAIPKFDDYLSERRQGLFFVENLADALNLEGEGLGSAFGISQEPSTPRRQSVQEATPLPLPSPAPRRPSRTGFVSLLSPRPSHSRTISAFSTPPPPPLSRRVHQRSSSLDEALPTTTSKAAPISPARAGPASPFAAHYRQTGSIKVQPIVVSTPLMRSHTAGDDEVEADEEDASSASPTRRLSRARSTTTPSEGSSGVEQGDKKRTISPVTLSTILDNVIVLEEFLKELASIIHVRRGFGVDGVRFL